jgi:hypothetical protein
VVTANPASFEITYYIGTSSVSYQSSFDTTATMDCGKSFAFSIIDSDGTERAEVDFTASETSLFTLNPADGSFSL